jgi:TATA-box binding protein (TBP) (component of TFIID and TFIIIB)
MSKYVNAFVADVKPPGGNADQCRKDVMNNYLPLQNNVANVGLCKSTNRKFTDSRPFAHVPPRFEAAVVMHIIYTDQTTILVFTSGCVVVVGSKSPEQTIHAIHRLRYMLECDGIETSITDFEFVNMVYSVRVSGIPAIDIAAISRAYMKNTLWRPNTFPGLRMDYKDTLLRIFDTCEIVGMGLHQPRQIRKTREFIRGICTRFACKDHIPPPSKRYVYRIKRQNEVLTTMPLASTWLSTRAKSRLRPVLTKATKTSTPLTTTTAVASKI